jgi:hypothetical protein
VAILQSTNSLYECEYGKDLWELSRGADFHDTEYVESCSLSPPYSSEGSDILKKCRPVSEAVPSVLQELYSSESLKRQSRGFDMHWHYLEVIFFCQSHSFMFGAAEHLSTKFGTGSLHLSLSRKFNFGPYCRVWSPHYKKIKWSFIHLHRIKLLHDHKCHNVCKRHCTSVSGIKRRG